ncbi:uncharacterized protein A4U43_C05F11100 [Asparagus officinalis]|uniref:WW domain-containing protein n=1 Tax=Asparagus officinalis TaxID=4686 RepID=A0A5P1EUK1_ASPOF|nr:uncharacterized protein A4U43_C05F11100 [Asparagus officinalis]
MAAYPTIETIKECLKKFCAAKGLALPPPVSPEIANKTINLNCNFPVCPGWEQFLDIKTGEVYFINKKSGVRINNKPHNAQGHSYGNTKINRVNGKSVAFVAPAPIPTVLVVCNKCTKCMMVAKDTKACPRCGQILIHFIDERCF